MVDRPSYCWTCRDRQVALGSSPVIMGILNVTPDSFSDGGDFEQLDAALQHANQMLEEGAHIIDVGGESTRPGSESVDQDTEIARVVPVISRLAKTTDALISIDTMKSGVAEAALEAGAHIVNDVSAGTYDPEIATVAARYQAGLVLMHMQGMPRDMQEQPAYADVVADVRAYLERRIEEVLIAGVEREALCIDPGIGFGKSVDHNLDLLVGLPALADLEVPVLVGLSRKSFLGKITGAGVEQRIAGSLAGLVYSILRGAHILRVHDVKESCEAAIIADIVGKKELLFE